MKPIALLMNDLHISKDNISEFEKNWGEALGICNEYQIKNLFIGGDVFTTRNVQYLAPMLAVQTCLRKAAYQNIKTTIAFGNHDCPVYGKMTNWCDLYAYIAKVEIIDDFYVFPFEDMALAMVSYFSEESVLPVKLAELDDCLKEKHIDFSKVILYLHAGVHGALGDFDIPNEIPQEPLLKYGRVLCSHYHNRTKIKGTNIEYIGSSRAHTFGEDEEKGYTVLYDNGSTKFIKNQVNVRYVTEDLDINKDLSEWKNNYGSLYNVRLRIHCKASEVETIDKDALFARGANKIEFVTEKIKAIEQCQANMEDKFDSMGLQIEYKSFCNEKDIDSRFGINYLSKIQ